MKKFTLRFLPLCVAMLCSTTFVNAQSEAIDLNVEIIRKPSGPGIPRSPVQLPVASIDGHTFSVSGTHPDYWVRIVNIDDEDDVVYETPMTAGTSSIELPSALSGDFQIQLIWDNWMFYGWITL